MQTTCYQEQKTAALRYKEGGVVYMQRTCYWNRKHGTDIYKASSCLSSDLNPSTQIEHNYYLEEGGGGGDKDRTETDITLGLGAQTSLIRDTY